MRLLISYDGTPNDDDAIALGRMLAVGGAEVALAYVRHWREFDPRREELADFDARARLERGAELLGDPDAERHVVFGPATAESLSELAERLGAQVIVFGSDYRTPPGHVEPGATAQHLIEGGPVALAIAAAGLRLRSHAAIETIAVPRAGPRNDAARQTAARLAVELGASVVEPGREPVDLIVVGSKPGAPPGRVALGGEERKELERARASVLLLAADRPLEL
jgi:nucleotide-binding universal stress UspA family protein